MIEFIERGNLFKSGAQAVVNTVNCFGVSGKGIALEFKRRYPGNHNAYAEACSRRAIRTGEMFVYKTGLSRPEYIFNFPTKRHWKNPSRLIDIVAGLRALVREIQARKIESIAIPALGCNNGGLSWQIVRTDIERELAGLSDVRCLVYAPLED